MTSARGHRGPADQAAADARGQRARDGRLRHGRRRAPRRGAARRHALADRQPSRCTTARSSRPASAPIRNCRSTASSTGSPAGRSAAQRPRCRAGLTRAGCSPACSSSPRSLLAIALAWGAWFGRDGPWGWAIGGALLILFGYALFLALEFALLARVRGVRSGAARQLRATAARSGGRSACPRRWCSAGASRSARTPSLTICPRAQGRLGVVLVHGFVCNRGFWNPWLRRFRQADVPFVAVNLEPVFGSHRRLRRHRRRRGGARARTPAARRWWWRTAWAGWRCGPGCRVARRPMPSSMWSPSVAAPRHLAGALGPHAQRPADAPRQRLAGAAAGRKPRAAGAPPYARFTCFYSHCDNIVFPPSTATLPGRTTATCPAARTCTAAQPEVFEAVWSRLAAAQG